MKTKTKILVLLLVVITSLFYISCEKDLYDDAIKNNSRELKIKNVSLSEIDFNTSFKILEKVKRLKYKSKRNKLNENNQTNKFTYNAVFDLYIDYDNGKQIELDGSFYYTFPMFSKSEENLENIVFVPNENGQVDLYFVKYDVTPEDLKYLTDDEKNNLSIQVYRETGQLICFDVINRFLKYPEGCQETHSNGYTCTPEVVTEITTFCDWVSAGPGGSSSSGYNGSTSGGSGGGIGSTNNVTIPPIITSIIGLTENQLNFKDFINNLSEEQEDWWDNEATDDDKQDIENYLNQNVNNPSAFIFIQQVIDILIVNPLPYYSEMDFPGKNDGMPYKWWENDDYIKDNLRIYDDTNLYAVAPEPNAREIFLFARFPLQALFHVRNSNLALQKTVTLVNDGTLTHRHNGKGDAYRHAFWNARDTTDIGPIITKLFTDAHEWNTTNDPLELQMDLFNNQQGRNIGSLYNFSTSDTTISNAVLIAVFDGILLYLTPLADHEGQNILEETELKPTNQ